MMYLHSLDKKLSEKDFGGKASGLSGIARAGIKIPLGYAIHKDALNQFKKGKELYPDFKKELEKIIEEKLGPKLIVRSSAIGEDSDDYSFAGQFDSFVIDNEQDQLEQAVMNCWKSLSNERALSYQQISGRPLSEMGVVIQKFVEAEYSGVLFTRSPYKSDKIYAEYVKGGAEPLVSGKVTPESFSADEEAILDNPKTLPFDHKLLIKYALHLKDHFNKNLDIEWIFVDGDFYLVQARPIKLKNEDKVYWTSTNLNENYPSHISPLLASIARESYYHYFKNLSKILKLDADAIGDLEPDFSNSVGFFGNRIYYNMTSIHNIIAASPYHKYFKGAFNNFVGYDEKDTASRDFNKKPSLLKLIIRLSSLNMKLPRHVKIIDEKVGAYAEEVENAKIYPDFSRNFHGFLNLRFYQWYHASLADLFSMIHYKLLGSLTKRIYGKEHRGIHNSLIQAIPGLISNEPLNASWGILEEIGKIPGAREYFLDNDAREVLDHINSDPKWTDIRTRVENYLQKWGFRCSEELLLNSKNYADSPDKYIELLQSYLKSNQVSPKDKIREKNIERKKLLRKAIGKLFVKRHVLFPVAFGEAAFLLLIVKLCRKAIFYREQVRYRQAQMYYNFKRTVHQLGEEFKTKDLIDSQMDILFLNYKEIGSLIYASDIYANDYKVIIEERKSIFKKEAEKDLPESFETIFGQPPVEYHPELNIKGGKEFSGLPASGGKIRARAKVLTSVLEIEKLEKGDILVTKQTDPGWAMAFPIIGGIIVERGGALSHGAIVAREFGIPAVLGIDSITEIITDNDEILLDGDLGKINILS